LELPSPHSQRAALALILSILLLLAAIRPATAQDPWEAPKPGDAGRPVELPDAARPRTAADAERAGDHLRAAESYFQALTRFPAGYRHYLLPAPSASFLPNPKTVTSGFTEMIRKGEICFFRPAVDVLAARVAALPPGARRSHRDLVDLVATPLFRRGLAAGDVALLSRTAELFGRGSSAAPSAEAAGDILWERGEALAATRLFERALSAGLGGSDRVRVLRKLCSAALRCGLRRSARKALTALGKASPEDSGPAAGWTAAAESALARLSEFGPFTGETAPWISPRRAGTAPHFEPDACVYPVAIGGLLPLSPLMDFHDDSAGPAWAACTDGDCIYWRNESGLACFEPLSGAVLWATPLEGAANVTSLVCDARRIYVSMVREERRGAIVLRLTGLSAFDRETGTELWSTLPDEALESGGIVGRPLLFQGSLYTVSLRDRAGQIWVSLDILDAETGKPRRAPLPLYHRQVSAVSREIIEPAMVRMDRWAVLIAGSGLVMGIDLGGPAVAWALRYPRPVRIGRIPPRINPALASGDRAVLLPYDSEVVLVVNPRSGAVLRTVERGKYDTALGIRRGILALTDGVWLRFVDLETGESTYTLPRIEDADLRGACLTEEAVVVPSARGIVFLEGPRAAKSRLVPVDTFRLERAPRRILAAPGWFHLASREHVVGFARRDEAESRIAALLKTEKRKIALLRSLGLVRLSSGKPAEALEAFDTALKAATGVAPGEEASLRHLAFEACRRLWETKGTEHLRRALELELTPQQAHDVAVVLAERTGRDDGIPAAVRVWQEFSRKQHGGSLRLESADGKSGPTRILAAMKVAEHHIHALIAGGGREEQLRFERTAQEALKKEIPPAGEPFSPPPLAEAKEKAALFRALYPGTRAASRLALLHAENYIRRGDFRSASIMASDIVGRPGVRREEKARALFAAALASFKLGEVARTLRFWRELRERYADVRLRFGPLSPESFGKMLRALIPPLSLPSDRGFSFPLTRIWRSRLNPRDNKVILRPIGDAPEGLKTRIYVFSEIVIPRGDATEGDERDEEGPPPEEKLSSYRIDCIDAVTGNLVYPCDSYNKMLAGTFPVLAWCGEDLLLWDGCSLSRIDNHTGKRHWYKVFDPSGHVYPPSVAFMRCSRTVAILLLHDKIAAYDSSTGRKVWDLVLPKPDRPEPRGRRTWRSDGKSFVSVSVWEDICTVGLNSGEILVCEAATGAEKYRLNAGPFAGNTAFSYKYWLMDRIGKTLTPRRSEGIDVAAPSHRVCRGRIYMVQRRYADDTVTATDLPTGRTLWRKSFPREAPVRSFWEHYVHGTAQRLSSMGKNLLLFQHPGIFRVLSPSGDVLGEARFPPGSEVAGVHVLGEAFLAEFQDRQALGGLGEKAWTLEDSFESLTVTSLGGHALVTSIPLQGAGHSPLLYLLDLGTGAVLNRWLPRKSGILGAVSAADGRLLLLLYRDALEAFAPGDPARVQGRLDALDGRRDPPSDFLRADLHFRAGRPRKAFTALDRGLRAQALEGQPLDLEGIRRIKTLHSLQKELYRPEVIDCPMLDRRVSVERVEDEPSEEGNPADDGKDGKPTRRNPPWRFRLRAPLTVDGNARDWDGIPEHVLDPAPAHTGYSTRILRHRPPGRTGLKPVRWRTALAGEEVFFLFEVPDPHHVPPQYRNQRIQDGDRLVLFLEGSKIVLALGEKWTLSEAYYPGEGTVGRFEPQAKVRRKGGVTVYELSLPLRVFGQARPWPLKARFRARSFPHLPGPGEELSFGFAVYDQDASGRWAALFNCPGALEDYDESLLLGNWFDDHDERFMSRLRPRKGS
jgi:outer membrane protein assembly factor BamB